MQPKLSARRADITTLAVDTKVTAGYRLPACYVIHTVGPVWHGGGSGEVELLASCYRRSIELATANRILSLAFPAISTGVYGYPAERAARVAVDTVRDLLRTARAWPSLSRRTGFPALMISLADFDLLQAVVGDDLITNRTDLAIEVTVGRKAREGRLGGIPSSQVLRIVAARVPAVTICVPEKLWSGSSPRLSPVTK